MAKMSLSHHRTGPPTQDRHQVQSAFGHSTPAVCGLPFIQPVCNETGNTHHDDDDQVSGGGGFHVLSTSYSTSIPCSLYHSASPFSSAASVSASVCGFSSSKTSPP